MTDTIDFTTLLHTSKRKAKNRVSIAEHQVASFEYELKMAKNELEYAKDDLYKIERFSRIYDAPREKVAPSSETIDVAASSIKPLAPMFGGALSTLEAELIRLQQFNPKEGGQ